MRNLGTIVGAAALAAVMGFAGTAFAGPGFEGFETDNGDWVFYVGAPPSGRVLSGAGTLGVSSASGAWHAELVNLHDAYQAGYGSAGYSYFGGADPVYQGSFYQAVDVYIDPSWAAGLGFWIDMSPRDTDDSSLYAAEGNFRLTADGASVAVQAINSSILTTINAAGWYTFEIVWSKGANPTDLINMTLNVYDSASTLLGTEDFQATFPQGSHPGESQYLGNNSYVWFTVWENNFAEDVVAIDNVRTGLRPPISKEITSGPCMSDPSENCPRPTGEFAEVVDGIANGSFELGVCNGAFHTKASGSGLLQDWTIGLDSIDHICSYWTADDGARSLDMSGVNAGSITQTLTGLTPGTNYQVTFGLAGNSDVLGEKNLRVSVDTGSSSADYAFNTNTDCGGNCSHGNMGWTEKTYAFTADDGDADLTFASLTATSWGPALDNVKLFEEVIDDEIAVAVLAPSDHSIHYDFKITVDTFGLTNPVVYDTVPAEWTVTHIDEGAVGPDDNTNNDENLPDADIGVGCGGFDAGLGYGLNVTVSRDGNSKNNKCSSDTDIVWDMDPNELDMIRVDLQSRGPKKNGLYKPTFCGPLYLNYGAELMDGETPIATSNRLVVAAVFDLNGGGIDPTGQGDEDNDGATDIDEVRNLGTDPCNEDTDEDGVLDGADDCPLEGVFGYVDEIGCPLPA